MGVPHGYPLWGCCSEAGFVFCLLPSPTAWGGTQDSAPLLNHMPVPNPQGDILNRKPVWYVGLSRSEDNLADNLVLLDMVIVSVCPSQTLRVFGTRAEFLRRPGWPCFPLSWCLPSLTSLWCPGGLLCRPLLYDYHLCCAVSCPLPFFF